MNRFDLAGKVAIVTGGNGGIGLGMATALAEAGCAIHVWGRNAGKNAAAVERLKAEGGRGARTDAQALRPRRWLLRQCRCRRWRAARLHRAPAGGMAAVAVGQPRRQFPDAPGGGAPYGRTRR